MSDGWSVERKGFGRFVSKLEAVRKAPVVLARVDGVATTGTYRRTKKGVYVGLETESRTAGKNITIIRSLAKNNKMDAVGLVQKDMATINKLWASASSAFVRTGRIQDLLTAANSVAAEIVKSIKKRVEAGELPEVKPETQKRKDREGIRPGLPSLIRTGQLMRSLVPGAKKGKR